MPIDEDVEDRCQDTHIPEQPRLADLQIDIIDPHDHRKNLQPAIEVQTGEIVEYLLHGLSPRQVQHRFHRDVRRELGDAAEILEINDETGIHLLRMKYLHELDRRAGGSARGQQAPLKRIAVNASLFPAVQPAAPKL